MKRLRLTTAAVAGFLFLAGSASAMDGVVASIKPVHSLVAAVMGDTGTPDLLVQGAASPHTYSLRPSEARKLDQAKVVFWVGEGMETFLTKPLQSLATGAKTVSLSQTAGLTVLNLREGGSFELHEHDDHDDHDHDHAHESHDEPHHEGHGKDMHLWLDPENARVMVKEIAATLAEADPTNASTYQQNANTLDQRLAALIQETSNALADVKDKPFIVFHDAYHYFEDRFGLHAAGSISINPETPPSAQRVREIQHKIAESNASCVFAEPQFEPGIVSVVTEGTSARTGVLDPLGADLKDGPDLYFELIGNLAASIKNCLSDL